MKLTVSQLRSLIAEALVETAVRHRVRKELMRLREAGTTGTKPTTGTAGVASEPATDSGAESEKEKVKTNPVVKRALDQVTSTDQFTKFLYDVSAAAAERGINKQKAAAALKQAASGISSDHEPGSK